MSDTATTASAKADGFRSSLARTRNKPLPIKILGLLSSLWSAATLLAALTVVIAIATYYERDYGREAVAVMIYQTWWFNSIFLLLAINIFGAAAVRYPWKPRQAGFVITHLGLLTVMAGFAVAGHDRLDGMLAVTQGEAAAVIEREREELTVTNEATGEITSTRFEVIQYADYPGFWRFSGDLLLRSFGLRLVEQPMVSPSDQRELLMAVAGRPIYLRRVVDTASEEMAWEPAAQGQAVAQLDILPEGAAFGAMNGQAQAIFLPRGQRVTYGPLVLRHFAPVYPPAVAEWLAGPAPEDLAEHGRLVVFQDGRLLTAAVPDQLPAELRLGPELAVRVRTYQPHVLITDTGFQAPDDRPLAPFLVFQWGTGPADQRQWSGDLLADGLDPLPQVLDDGSLVAWQHPTAWQGHPDRPLGGSFDFAATTDGGVLGVRLSHRNGWIAGGSVGDGWSTTATMPAGSITLTFDQMMDHAQPAPVPVAMKPNDKDRAANYIELQVGEGSQAPRIWIRRGEVAPVEIGEGNRLLVRYERVLYDLADRHGFAVALKRFINEKDPGGDSNASYASVVEVRPVDGGKAAEHVISMNEPLSFNGVTLYQTARSELPDGRFVSFFTVAQDPGRLLKYLGSLILVTGIVTMYVTMAVIRSRATARRATSAGDES